MACLREYPTQVFVSTDFDVSCPMLQRRVLVPHLLTLHTSLFLLIGSRHLRIDLSRPIPPLRVPNAFIVSPSTISTFTQVQDMINMLFIYIIKPVNLEMLKGRAYPCPSCSHSGNTDVDAKISLAVRPWTDRHTGKPPSSRWSAYISLQH